MGDVGKPDAAPPCLFSCLSSCRAAAPSPRMAQQHAALPGKVVGQLRLVVALQGGGRPEGEPRSQAQQHTSSLWVAPVWAPPLLMMSRESWDRATNCQSQLAKPTGHSVSRPPHHQQQ